MAASIAPTMLAEERNAADPPVDGRVLEHLARRVGKVYRTDQSGSG